MNEHKFQKEKLHRTILVYFDKDIKNWDKHAETQEFIIVNTASRKRIEFIY